ncbi:hypothetical protein KCP77_05495 [Salmonella enterica subsp. enterica]|nr:hypothetical protein KCP77_05495 [Salmonella enterica subsp. enterica]
MALSARNEVSQSGVILRHQAVVIVRKKRSGTIVTASVSLRKVVDINRIICRLCATSKLLRPSARCMAIWRKYI